MDTDKQEVLFEIRKVFEMMHATFVLSQHELKVAFLPILQATFGLIGPAPLSPAPAPTPAFKLALTASLPFTSFIAFRPSFAPAPSSFSAAFQPFAY